MPSVVFKQLVIRPFWTDFDLSGRPPDYKTVALPIELRRRLLKGGSSQKTTNSEQQTAPEAGGPRLLCGPDVDLPRPLFGVDRSFDAIGVAVFNCKRKYPKVGAIQLSDATSSPR